MKRGLRIAALLVGVQVLFVGLYFAVEERRTAGNGAKAMTLGPSSGATVLLRRVAPELSYRTRADDSEHRLSALRGRPLVLHFWATWCPPCREELPGLLAFGEREDAEVLAVSLDPEWGAVMEFFEREPPRSVVLADADAVRGAFEVAVLPVTYVVDVSGNLRLRLSGSRDWSAVAVRQSVLDVLRER